MKEICWKRLWEDYNLDCHPRYREISTTVTRIVAPHLPLESATIRRADGQSHLQSSHTPMLPVSPPPKHSCIVHSFYLKKNINTQWKNQRSEKIHKKFKNKPKKVSKKNSFWKKYKKKHFVPKSRWVARLLNVYFYFYQMVFVCVLVLYTTYPILWSCSTRTLLLNLQVDVANARAVLCQST